MKDEYAEYANRQLQMKQIMDAEEVDDRHYAHNRRAKIKELAGTNFRRLPEEEKQRICTMMANTIEVWDEERSMLPEPWGCVLNVEPSDGPMPDTCDGCPVRNLCPNPCKL